MVIDRESQHHRESQHRPGLEDYVAAEDNILGDSHWTEGSISGRDDGKKAALHRVLIINTAGLNFLVVGSP